MQDNKLLISNNNENINIRTYNGKVISFPKFYDEEKTNKKNEETLEKVKKEEILDLEKYKIDTKKIFASLLDVYKYLDEISNFINLNLKAFDEQSIEKINIDEYMDFHGKTYEKIRKVKAYLSLRGDLNISNKNINKNNEKISEDVLVLENEIYQFGKQIIKAKKDKANKNKKKEKEKQEEKQEQKQKDNKLDNKTIYRLLDKKMNIFHEKLSEIRYLESLKESCNESKNKSENEEKLKTLIKENALIYISIYRLFALYENLFNINVGRDKDISLEKIKDIIGKVFNSENLKEFNNIKNKIENKTNKNTKDLNEEQIKEKEVKEEQQLLPNEAEKIVKNVSKYFGEDFENEMKNIFNNNQIDFFISRDKISKNVTIRSGKGYIILQNTKNKVDLFTFVHEIGHLIRYISVKRDCAIIFIEESIAISFEFLLLDNILNDKKLKFKLGDQINDAILAFLSKTFDTIECFLFQQMVLEEIGKIKSFKCNEDDLENKILKNVVSKRKEVLRKMGYKDFKKKSYNFASSYSYLQPYYSLNYSLGVFVGFELFCKFKETSNSENLKFFKTKKLDLKGVLNFLGKENVEDLIDVQKLFKYFEKTLKALNNK